MGGLFGGKKPKKEKPPPTPTPKPPAPERNYSGALAGEQNQGGQVSALNPTGSARSVFLGY